MANVYWFDEARDTYDGLPADIQQAIDESLRRVNLFPAMYQAVEVGSYKGSRRFLVRGRFHVDYRIRDGQCYVQSIRRARAAPP
jgi:hypothetical protein